jgi:VanW like protein
MSEHVLRRVPTRWDMAAFEAKASLFRLKRAIVELAAHRSVGKCRRGNALIAAPVLARVTSPLWNNLAGSREFALTAGKVQNLRLAIRDIDGVELEAGETFSFWRQVGRTTRRRGFVDGRELREGCLIRNVGGGLCQLSNGLYEAAVNAGLEIVERHAHSRIVPGSRGAHGRDATVFWNYVDLRFRAGEACRIEAKLARGLLEIVIRGQGRPSKEQFRSPLLRRETANDCTTCDETDCHKHDPEIVRETRNLLPTAWLVDACWPEFATLMAAKANKEDALFVPQRLRQTERHAWPRGFCGSETHATFLALRRAFELRRAPRQGRILQSLMLRYDRAIAAHYARRLSHLHTHLVISQSLLPHLWQMGVLGGRSFDVFMERSPIGSLQAALDEAAARYRESPTLADFRAPAELVAAENEALAEARLLYTPHRQLAGLYPGKTEVLDWSIPVSVPPVRRGGRSILFPASALGRKGAYALRDALVGLDVELVVAGGAREHDRGFWGDLDVRELNGAAWPDCLAGVVLPAIVEHQPRALLRALAMGLPVIASEACGLGSMPGVLTISTHDINGLRQEIQRLLSAPVALAA